MNFWRLVQPRRSPRWHRRHAGNLTRSTSIIISSRPSTSRGFWHFERLAEERKDAFLPGGVAPAVRKFYYEVAQANHPGALAGLLKLAPITNVLYGSDYPLRPVSEVTAGIAKYEFTAAQRRAIERGNAVKLVPRLSQV